MTVYITKYKDIRAQVVGHFFDMHPGPMLLYNVERRGHAFECDYTSTLIAMD